MLTHYKFAYLKPSRYILLMIIIAAFALSNCGEKPQVWDKKSTELVGGDYIANYADYSEFNQLVEEAGLTSLLKIRGPFTIFLPTNEAMFAFYQKKNVSKLTDLDHDFLVALARTHVVPFAIPSGDIGLGALREKNLLEDYLVTEFSADTIIVNKHSRVIDKDVQTANGYIHIIDQVIEPVFDDVFTVVASNPSFEIFTQGLRKTNLKDTLELISFPFGSKIARTRYTILAVPDTIYNRYGIYSVNDLIAWCGANPDDDLTYIENPFYRYMEYHCLTGAYFLSNLTTKLYSVLSRDNNLSITIAEDYKINLDKKTNEYTHFLLDHCNFPAKNGAMHAVADILPVTIPSPETITHETTDYFDFQQGDYIGKNYARWSDGMNSFEKIKFEGNYLLYYYKPNHGRTPILNNDCLSMLGFWWLEITTPKIMKGNYKVSANIWSGGEDLPIFAAYIDDVYYTTINARIGGASMVFGDVRWPTTSEHKIKVVCRGWGVIFWDSVIFTPIK